MMLIAVGQVNLRTRVLAEILVVPSIIIRRDNVRVREWIVTSNNWPVAAERIKFPLSQTRPRCRWLHCWHLLEPTPSGAERCKPTGAQVKGGKAIITLSLPPF